jgi:hypothetical protein
MERQREHALHRLVYAPQTLRKKIVTMGRKCTIARRRVFFNHEVVREVEDELETKATYDGSLLLGST